MPLIQAKCNNCGANLEFDDSRERIFCSSCGAQYIYEKPVTVNINIGTAGQSSGGASGLEDNVFRISDRKYAMPFVRSEQRAKQDMLCHILSYEDAPLDAACRITNISIRKEYCPVAFYEITGTAEWQATSIWEHKEKYQVPRQETVYYDSRGREYKEQGSEVIDGHVYYYKPESRIVYDTRTRIVTDNIQQTTGRVPPATVRVKVWTAKTGEELSAAATNWIGLDKDFEYIDDARLKECVLIKENVKVEQSLETARKYAEDEIERIALGAVPGDRYEGFNMNGEITEAILTYRYLPLYHITYDYDGSRYEYYITGGPEDKDFYIKDHPADRNITERLRSLDAEISSYGKRKKLWITGAIVSGIIGAFSLVSFLVSLTDSANAAYAVTGGIISLINICFMVLSIIMAVRSGNQEQTAAWRKKDYISGNSKLKNRIFDLFRDDSVPDDGKAATVEEWLRERKG